MPLTQGWNHFDLEIFTLVWKLSEIYAAREFEVGKIQITNCKSQVCQRGYMMITLMLALALTAIGNARRPA